MATFEHNSKAFGYLFLDELEGVQQALTLLGYKPGTADGKDGPNTQRAVRAFQTAVKIGVDGIAGPETKAALVVALEQKAVA
jgi:peptidoglycan hydrolase-like protein with peptidoglycan-binding domain